MKYLFMLVFLFSGCTAAPEAKAPVVRRIAPRPLPNQCPPLPTLREGATVFEERLLNETIRLLYAQCAESKS